ncbi:hypothetical protein YPPY34_0408, partial [Yersinia pestis PY-34]
MLLPYQPLRCSR